MTSPSSSSSSGSYVDVDKTLLGIYGEQRNAIKSLEKFITDVRNRVAENKTRSTVLEGERCRLRELKDAVMAEGLEIDKKISEKTSKIQELQQELADLQEEKVKLEENKAKTRERSKEFGKQTKKTERGILECRRFVMTKEGEISNANAEIEGRNKILEAVKLFRDQIWEMMSEDPEAPLPPVPDFHRLYNPPPLQPLVRRGLDLVIPRGGDTGVISVSSEDEG
ncbi:hypothetical protein HK102_009738, partial [Quaeritorhiza haematococci]